nr:hypothetical protein GCM10010200_026760 [Actinomadura rugatobispora]
MVPVPRGPRARTAILLAHSVITQLLTFVLRPTMTYRALELQVPPAVLGALAASFAIAPLVLALPAGRLVDRVGERRVMVGGALLLTAASLAFLVLGGTVGGLLAASMLLGTGHLGCVVGQQALVANTAGRGSYDTAFGHYTFAASLGQAAGPALIALFGGARAIPDTTAIFAWTTGIAAALVVLSALLAGSGHARTGGSRAAEGGVRTLLRTPGLRRALLTSCVVLATLDITLCRRAQRLPARAGRRAGPVVGDGRGVPDRPRAGVDGVAVLPGTAHRRVRAAGGARHEHDGRGGRAGAGGGPAARVGDRRAAGRGRVRDGRGTAAHHFVAGGVGAAGAARAGDVAAAGGQPDRPDPHPSVAGLPAAGTGAGGVLFASALGLGWAGVAARRLPSGPGS